MTIESLLLQKKTFSCWRCGKEVESCIPPLMPEENLGGWILPEAGT